MTILHLFRWVAASHGNAISRSCEFSRPGLGSDFSILQTASSDIFLWKSFARRGDEDLGQGRRQWDEGKDYTDVQGMLACCQGSGVVNGCSWGAPVILTSLIL